MGKKKSREPTWFKPTKEEVAGVVSAGEKSPINPSAILGGPVKGFVHS